MPTAEHIRIGLLPLFKQSKARRFKLSWAVTFKSGASVALLPPPLRPMKACLPIDSSFTLSNTAFPALAIWSFVNRILRILGHSKILGSLRTLNGDGERAQQGTISITSLR